jgi:putative ABC transport system permease protein
MLGIVIGITAVVLMTTAIKGIDNSFQNGISALGSDVLYIDKWAWFVNNDWWKMRNRRNLKMEDYEKFRDMARSNCYSPVINSRQTVKFGDKRSRKCFS